jgi:hypothetical protein
MKSNVLYLAIFLSVFLISIKAQVYEKYEDGTTIFINLRTTPPINEGNFGDKLRFWQIRPQKMNRLIRYITNENNGYYIGYLLDYEIINEKQFRVSIKSPDSIDYEEPFKGKFKKRLLTNYPGEIIVNDGDIISLDLLATPGQEVKTQDLILLTRTPLTNRNYFSRLEEPKDFQINDIKLRLADFKVSINGISLKQKSFYDVQGHILAFRFKGRGEIYLSLFPQKGFNFQKVGTVDGKILSFKIANDTFQIESSSYIWNSNEVRWNLWGYYIPEEKLKDKVPESMDFQGRVINNLRKK